MVLKRLAILFFLVIPCFTGRGQLVDSLRKDFSISPRLYAAFDTRNSFITNYLAKIRGVRVGLSYNRRTRVGLCWNWLGTDLIRNVSVQKGDSLHLVEGRIGFYFLAPFIEYAFLQRRDFQIEIPVRLGFGLSRVRYTDPDGIKRSSDGSMVALYEPGIVFTYRFLRYFGASAGFGFRIMLIPNRSLPESFTSPVYSFGVRIYAGDLWADVKQWLDD
jgi:hypothetical protein